MEQKNITYYWIQYKRYWGLIIRRAFSAAWVRIGGFFAIVVPLLIGAVQSLQTKPFESLSEFMARSDMMGYFAFISIAVLLVLVLLSLEPVRLHSEQEEHIDALQLRLTPNLSVECGRGDPYQ